ncbi:PEP-CTERM sorting domain-containing protein [Terriglobus sp.]|uniref:PEP-CTERM sorting domain-containing protein n=1 Tax=Terriglobus sp. TaxID=1889013 RepID=UPI003B0025A3
MRHFVFSIATALLLMALSPQAKATPYDFTVSGGGVSAHVTLNYGSATDARYSQGYQITGISGTFSDNNLGISNANIVGLENLNRVSPEPTNLLAPHDFSGYAVATGLGPEANGFLHYDNLFYPAGSPQTATDYPFSGGVLDIYGVLFDLGNGDVVNLWSNGAQPRVGLNYGVAVVTHDTALDYVNGVAVAQTPEPGTLCLLGTGLVAALSRRRMLRRA